MPAHTRRTWGVTDTTDIDTLANALTQMTWTLCTGFRLGGHLFLNDAFTEDSAQEHAVVRETDGQQVESTTFS